jgi:hypothetical protein
MDFLAKLTERLIILGYDTCHSSDDKERQD